jgi:magnesium transporter
MRSLADVFGIHPLAMRGAVETHHRPKLERYDDTLVLVLKTVDYVEHDRVENVRHFVKTGEVMYAIAEHVVDGYEEVAELVESDIDVMRANVFSPIHSTDVEPLYLLKREIAELRHAISPTTTSLAQVETDHSDLVALEVRRYLRAILERHVQAAERIVSNDQMLSTLIEAALGKIALQQNSDMRKISAWAALAAVPTLVAGLYGMYFDNIPLEHWEWGLPGCHDGDVVRVPGLVLQLRRNRWLWRLV